MQKIYKIVAVWKGEGGGRDIILNGHCDVVPVYEKDVPGWKSDPWKATVREDNIYGRGTADMKGGLVAAYYAMKALKDCNIRLKGDVILESVVGEELCHHMLGTTAVTRHGYKAPLAIVLEASDNTIELMAPSAASFTMKVKGKAIHASRANLVRYPQMYNKPSGQHAGVDAFRKMNKILDALYDMEEQWNFRWSNQILDESVGVGIFTFVPGIIRAGEYLVSVPGSAEVQGSYTYAPWLADGEAEQEIRDVIESVAMRDDWLRENPPEFNILYDWPGYMLDEDHPGCECMKKAIYDVTHKEAQIGAFSGADDATWLYKEGIPSFTFGPGSTNNNLHGNNEYISVEQL